MKNTLALIPLIICFSLLTGYNFMAAQWSAPTATAPGNNTLPPIHVGSDLQTKSGNFAANIVASLSEMRSSRYCDALGANCFDPARVNVQQVCPNTQFMRGINSDGTLVCATATTTSPASCRQVVTTINNGCPVQWGGGATCPAGSSVMRTYTVPASWCPGDGADVHNMIDCVSIVCS